MIASLVQFELLSRDAERAAHWSVPSPVTYREVYLQRLQERARIARRALAEAIQNAALDEFEESARIHLGLVDDDPNTSPLEIPEPDAGVRIRRLGPPRYFQGESTAADQPLSLSWTTVPTRRSLGRSWALALILPVAIAAMVAVRAAFASAVAGRLRWLGPASLAAALLVLAIATGPLPFAAGLAMAWLGWAGKVA
jgi:hypothetical protein